MKIYIAGRYSRRDEFRQVRDKLVKRGHTVTSRWLDETQSLDSQMGEETSDWYWKTQRVDLMDIDSAYSVLFFAEDPLVGTPRGGRHVEFGYALGMGIPIHVIGPRENVFHYNDHVRHFNSLEDFLAAY
jgi:hypothetical protein